MNTETNESKIRILDAARQEFAEKGFDGARVDEIARRADVNKALIYYYFKSKDELLQELLRQFMAERQAQRTADVALAAKDERLTSRIAAFDAEFLFAHRDILRIALMEDLKKTSDSGPTGNILANWLERAGEAKRDYAALGFKYRCTPRVMAAMYFFHMVPTFTFAVFGETFAKTLGIGFDELKAEYLKLTDEIDRIHFLSVFGHSNADDAPEVSLPGVDPTPVSGEMKQILSSFREDRSYTREEAIALLAPASGTPTDLLETFAKYGYIKPNADGTLRWQPGLPPVQAPSRPKPQAHLEITPAERERLVAKHMPRGRLESFPLKEKARIAVVEHISGLFEATKTYTEKQVDAILKSVADDHSKTRRYLVDYGYLRRKPDGSCYWTWERDAP